MIVDTETHPLLFGRYGPNNGNNLPAGAPYPEPFPRYDFMQDRAARMAQRLAGDVSVTLADLASVQNDVCSRGAARPWSAGTSRCWGPHRAADRSHLPDTPGRAACQPQLPFHRVASGPSWR